MNNLFTLTDDRYNFNLLAFQYHTLEYSLEILKNHRNILKGDVILKHKLDNYLLMSRLSIAQQLHKEDLPFDINNNLLEYLNNPNNRDLKNYINISKHIVAKDLNMASLCSKIDFGNHFFVIEGNDLICVDCQMSTIDSNYNDIEKKFLCSCARRKNRIVQSNSDFRKVMPIYGSSSEIDHNTFMTVA